ncbi:hypothetical protein ABK040_002869 [Willaertia magna]
MSPDKALFDNIYSFTIFNDEIIISDNDRLRKYNNITNKVTTIAGGGYSNNYIENTDATKTRLSAKRANIRYNYNHENQELYISIASDEYVGIIKTNNTGNLFEKTGITSNDYRYEGPFHIDTNGDMYFVPPQFSYCLMFYQNSTNQVNFLFCDDDFTRTAHIYSIVMGENRQLFFAISDVAIQQGFIKQYLFDEYRARIIVGLGNPGYNNDWNGAQTNICPLGLHYDFNSKVFYFTDVIDDVNIIRKYDPQLDEVTTLAGYNGYNSVDDGVPSSIVKINYPRDVFYYNGEIYFSDNDSRHGSRIRKITKDGLVYTVVGSYSVDYVGMEAPDINCMAMVGAIYKNNYYFIDSARNDGSLMRVNSTTNKIEEVISKTGIDKDIPNLVVVKDKFYYANKTSIISYDMINSNYWTYTPLTLIANIKAFAFDFSTEEIYVSECGKNGSSDIYHSRISKITTDGNYITVANLDNDRCAISMIVNGSNIYYIETLFSQNDINSTIVKLGKDGSNKQVIAGEGNSDNDYISAKDTKLYGPTSLVMTLREEIMFVEPSKNRIRKIKKDGQVLTLTMTGNELHNPNWIGLYDNTLLLTNQVELFVSDITLKCYGIKQMIQQIDNGVCIGSNQCSCSSGWKGDSSCSKVSCENQNSCSGHGTCTGPNQCTCQSGWKQSSDCSTISCEELGNCNDKGICVSSNVCQCISGFRGSNDCKQFSCDGVNNCTNGRGSCIGPNKCDCPIEYTGNDCGTLVYNCYGKLGNDSTACSGNGLCIGIDSCKCNSGVYGLQCDFIPEIKYSTKVSKYSTILFTTNIKSFNLNNNNFSYKWSQISGTNTLDLNTISIAGTDKIDFGIKANDNNLIQGETYGLQLNITRSEILNGKLTVVSLPISFTINKSPIINNYNLLDASTNNPIQSSVVAGETNIKAIITNAQDAEGKAIEYAFGYFTSTNERVYLSYFSQSKNSATFKLPLFISGKAKVFLAIRDELLDTDEKIVELTVTDPTANLNDNQLNNYIQNLVNNTNSNDGHIPIEQLDIATSLLNKPVSNPNDPNIKQQREELRNTIVNSLVASTSSQNDTSTVLNILSSVTQNTQELKLETAITALQLTLNITNNNNQQQQDKIVALTSQLINSVLTTSSTNMQVSEIIKNILDSISKSIVQSLISGQSQLIQTNNIKTYLVKDTVDSLAKSLNTTVISQLGISNLNLPIDALKTLFKNNGIDIANPVALGVNVVPNSIYNYLGQNITSPIFRINLFLNDGTSLNITNLLVPIEFEMTIISSVTGNNKCWYYNEKVKALRLDGVETVVINSNRVKCRVYHLTDFTTAPQIVSPSISVAKSTRVIGSTSKVHVSGANINVMSWLTIILCSLISVL